MTSRSTSLALYTIAALLLAHLVAILARSDSPTFLPAALAQRQAPIAGGAGLFVMPAQISSNQWGCYLMDVDRQTLCVYQFQPGAIQLKLVASRSFTNDTKLANFNTSPTPQETADLVNKQNQTLRGALGPTPDITASPSKGNN